jgi:hypothetical protein
VTEFLVEFAQAEVTDREKAESVAAVKLADEGHLVRLRR